MRLNENENKNIFITSGSSSRHRVSRDDAWIPERSEIKSELLCVILTKLSNKTLQ